MHRRTFIVTTGITAGSALTGCVFNRGSVQAGTLVIVNRQDQSHTVTVGVSKTSEDHEDMPPREDAPPPTASPLWHRDRSFEVSGGEKVRESGFISEPGAFYVNTRTETGMKASTWFGLYSGLDGVAEEHLNLKIDEEGRMSISTPVND